MHRRTWCLTLSILLCVIGLINSYAQAGQVQLSWDAPTTNTDGSPITDLAGYKIYYREAGGDFSPPEDVGNVTTYTLPGLQDGKTYFFAVRAYNITRTQESEFSNEVSTTLPLPVSIDSFTATPTLTATGAGGTASPTVTVTPPPVANFSENPTSGNAPQVVEAAESVKLRLEVEEGQESGLMQVASDEEASAGQYIWVPEGNGTILDPAENDNFVRYTFTVPKTDTYIIWGHVSPSVTGTGSFFMAMDDAAAESGDTEPGTEYLVWTVPSQNASDDLAEESDDLAEESDDLAEDTEPGTITKVMPTEYQVVPLLWVWDQAASDTEPIFFLEAGEHTLIIKQRESGTKLDQLLITNDLEYRP